MTALADMQTAFRKAAIRRWDEPHTFTVEGRGEFPFDMLRHSMAYPLTSDDAGQMGAATRQRRRVTLVGAMLRHINPKRWDSFGWPVVDGFDQYGLPIALNETEAA